MMGRVRCPNGQRTIFELRALGCRLWAVGCRLSAIGYADV